MFELCDLHKSTGVGETGEYLDPKEDRQVGLGLLGLANFLALHGVTYAVRSARLLPLLTPQPTISIHQLMSWRQSSERLWQEAAQIARAHGMERAFTVAPTASCSYRYTDLEGHTTAPEIAPPIARAVDRDSGTFGVESFDYGEVEIASVVGWDTYKLVVDEICRTFDQTGLFHGYSFNSWSDVVTYDQAFIQEWFESPQTSLYYALQVMPDTLRKDDASAIIEGDDYSDIWGLGFEALEDDAFCSSCAE